MSGQALLVDDLRTVEGLKGAGDGSKYFNPSLLSVPLISLKGETLGVINVNNKTSRERFTEEDQRMLQELAQEAGAVLGYEVDLARLFYEFQDTYITLRQARGPLNLLEEKISHVLKGAWPSGVTSQDGRHTRE
jgi:hypothetical protein